MARDTHLYEHIDEGKIRTDAAQKGFWKGLRNGAMIGGGLALAITGYGAALGAGLIGKGLLFGVGGGGKLAVTLGAIPGVGWMVAAGVGLLTAGITIGGLAFGASFLPAVGTVALAGAAVAGISGLAGGLIGAAYGYANSDIDLAKAYDLADARAGRDMRADTQQIAMQQQISLQKARLQQQAAELQGYAPSPAADHGLPPKTVIKPSLENPGPRGHTGIVGQ